MGGTLDRNGNETDFAYYTSGGSTGLLHTVSVHQGSSTGSVLSTTTKFYDPTTLMPTETVVDGSETDQSYDYLNRVVTTTVHPSSTLTLTSSSVYNRYQLLQTVDYYLRATSYVYDLMNRPLTVTQELRPGGPSITTSRQYNPAGLTTAAVDGNANRSLFYFDQRQRPVKTIVAACTPLEATTQTVYDANSNVVTRIDERGNAWPSTYTVRNRAATSADPLGDTTYNSYTTDGLLLSTTNANGHTSTNSYYPCCPRLLKVTDQYGNYKTFYYDFNGNTTQITDESGRTFNWTYDGMNRQTLMIAASGSLNLTSSTFYSPPPALGTIGASTTAVNPAGQTIVSSFDGMGRILSTSGNTAPMSYTYDATFGTGANAGLVMTAVVTGSGGTTLSTSALADGAGRTVRSFDGLGNAVYMTYDNNSNLLSTTDQDNRATVNAYDSRNRLTSTQQNTGGQFTTTSYSYDPTNNTTQVVDAEGKTTRYGYDLANRRTSTTYAYGTADARTWGMTYTPLGQLAALAKPGGVNIAYGYDNRELLLTKTYMQGSGTLGTDVFTYSPNRLLLSTTGGLYGMNVSRGTANYDAANRLTQETQNFGSLSKSVSYAYTPDSLVSEIVYADSTTVTRNYNNHRLLYQVLAGSTTQATFAYDPADRRSTMTCGNSAVTTWTLDKNSQVTALAVTLGSGTLQAWDYGYSNAGDPLSQTDASFGTMSEAYQYDGLHRLTAYQKGQITGSNSIAYPGASQAWQLTSGGRLVAVDVTVGTLATTDTRTHNNIHALTNRTAPAASTQLYDNDANQTDDGSQYKFVYDANDQLQQVLNRGTLALVASYAYDALGRCAQKYVASGGTTTNYFYNDQQVIEEYVNGGTAATYTYADGIDERIAMNRGGTLYYYHANRLGSTYLLTNGTAGIAERYAYSPYGSVAVSNSAYTSSGTVSSAGNPYLFTGREFDPESGLYNYRARTYDPVQGRFKQLDPIGVDGGTNLYEYVGSDPTDREDPSGNIMRTVPRCCVKSFTTPAGNVQPTFTQDYLGNKGASAWLPTGNYEAHFTVHATFEQDGAAGNCCCCAACCQYRQFVKGHYVQGAAIIHSRPPVHGNTFPPLSDTDWTEDVVYYRGNLHRFGDPVRGKSASNHYSSDRTSYLMSDSPGFPEVDQLGLNSVRKLGVDLSFASVIVDYCQYTLHYHQDPNPFSPQSYERWAPYIVREHLFDVKGTLNAAQVNWRTGLRR